MFSCSGKCIPVLISVTRMRLPQRQAWTMHRCPCETHRSRTLSTACSPPRASTFLSLLLLKTLHRFRLGRLDMVVVCSGLAAYVPGITGGSLTVLRVFRILRPLRSLRATPTLRQIVEALLGSIPGIINVLILQTMFFFLFALLGLQVHEYCAGRRGILFANRRVHFPRWNSRGSKLYARIFCLAFSRVKRYEIELTSHTKPEPRGTFFCARAWYAHESRSNMPGSFFGSRLVVEVFHNLRHSAFSFDMFLTKVNNNINMVNLPPKFNPVQSCLQPLKINHTLAR